jgi:hypothetical protein
MAGDINWTATPTQFREVVALGLHSEGALFNTSKDYGSFEELNYILPRSPRISGANMCSCCSLKHLTPR